MDKIHDKELRNPKNKDDQDYLRNDLDDAGDEEMEDRLINAARKKQMPLNIEEVSRLSRGNFDGKHMSSSVLSGVMMPGDL